MSSTEPADISEQPDDAVDDAEANENQSWDEFWAEVQRAEAAERTGPPTQTIRGVTVLVPVDLPLVFERKIDQYRNTDDEDVFKELLADLFGADVLDAWVENGMTAHEFEIVLAWGMSNGKGRPLSFRGAYELVRERDSDRGKASKRTRVSGGSAATGGRSKRTSGASTGSRRKR